MMAYFTMERRQREMEKAGSELKGLEIIRDEEPSAEVPAALLRVALLPVREVIVLGVVEEEVPDAERLRGLTGVTYSRVVLDRKSVV